MERVGIPLLELVVQCGQASLFGLLTQRASVDLRLCALQASLLCGLTKASIELPALHQACQIGLRCPQIDALLLLGGLERLAIVLRVQPSKGRPHGEALLVGKVRRRDASPVATEGTALDGVPQRPGLCLRVRLPHLPHGRVDDLLLKRVHVLLDVLPRVVLRGDALGRAHLVLLQIGVVVRLRGIHQIRVVLPATHLLRGVHLKRLNVWAVARPRRVHHWRSVVASAHSLGGAHLVLR